MPFKSEKQRRWMHANKPKMAKKWEKKKKREAQLKIRELIKKLVREIVSEINENTVRLSTMKDANFEPGQWVQILGKKGTVKLDKKSVKFLAKWIRQNSGKHGMGWSFTEGKLNEGKKLRLPNGVEATLDFKGIKLQQKGKKPVFLDRGELLKFFRATTKYLRYS